MQKNKKGFIILMITGLALILFFLYINQSTLNIIMEKFQKPTLILLEKHISAPYEAPYDSALNSYEVQGQEKDKLLVQSRRDVIVWHYRHKIFVAYKKGGKQYTNQQLFIYPLTEESNSILINFPKIEVSDFNEIKEYYDYAKTGRMPVGGPIE